MAGGSTLLQERASERWRRAGAARTAPGGAGIRREAGMYLICGVRVVESQRQLRVRPFTDGVARRRHRREETEHGAHLGVTEQDLRVSCCPPPQRHRAQDPRLRPRRHTGRPPVMPACRRHRPRPRQRRARPLRGRTELHGRRVEEVAPAGPPR
jgi:hypothetical protein